MSKVTSRYDTNRKIKSCLVSHKADLAGIVFSFSGKTASFHGRLAKKNGVEFKVEEVENLCRTIAGLPPIKFMNFELDDWTISASMGSFVITKKIISATAGADGQFTPHYIDSDEDIEDVLADQKK